MASNVHIAAAYRKAMLDGGTSGAPNIKTDANSGLIKVYDGTQPADGDVAVSTQTLLATLTMNATAFSGPSGTASTDQILTAGTITSANAAASSTATWFRLLKSDGTTKILDGSAGASGCDLNLTPAALTSGQPVNVTAMTLTIPK